MGDLLPLCKECKGVGEVNIYANQNVGQSYGARVVHTSPDICTACEGKEAILTPQGKVLLEFIQGAKEKGF